jgi:hypothetical protein
METPGQAALVALCTAHTSLASLRLFASGSGQLSDLSCAAVGKLSSLAVLDLCGAARITDAVSSTVGPPS